MHFRLLTLALVAAGLLAASPTARAEDRFGNFYVGVRGIGSYSFLNGVNTLGFTGTPEITNDDDLVAGVGGVVGYRFFRIPVRLEVEGAHRFRFDLDNRDIAAPSSIDYESNVATTTVVLNAILDWRNDSDFTPWIGGTIGWARNYIETTRTVLSTQAQQEIDRSQNEIAWGFSVGVDWDVTEDWTAGLAVRYINLGEVTTGVFAAGDSIEVDEYESVDILLTVSYVF